MAIESLKVRCIDISEGRVQPGMTADYEEYGRSCECTANKTVKTVVKSKNKFYHRGAEDRKSIYHSSCEVLHEPL